MNQCLISDRLQNIGKNQYELRTTSRNNNHDEGGGG